MPGAPPLEHFGRKTFPHPFILRTRCILRFKRHVPMVYLFVAVMYCVTRAAGRAAY